MNPVLIFGASRGTGLLLARRLREAAVPVYAMLRVGVDDAPLVQMGVQVSRGDAFVPADVARALALPDGVFDVVSTLGGREEGRHVSEHGTIHIADATVSARVERFVLVTSIGCGDMAPFRSERAVAAFGDSVDAKSRAEAYLRRLLPSATIVRPGGLLAADETGRGILTTDPQMHGAISRAELARLLHHVLCDAATAGGTFAAVDADLARCANPIMPFPLASPGISV